jgi:HK97 family phage portal protein
MTIAAVFACVRVLSESVAQLPLVLYRRLPEGGKVRAVEHPLYPILHDAPNDFQTSFEWREMKQGHTALRGNSYSFINRAGGQVRELLPIHPDKVEPKQEDWKVTYKVQMGSGNTREFKQGDILHIRGLSSDGVMGLSPVKLFREAMGLALATEKHGAKLFGNGTRLGGILKHPGTLSENGAARLKQSWEDAHAGVDNAFKTALLEEGISWEAVGMTSEDAQFLETRKFQKTEIASIFRVPPHLIGDLERSTNNNIEHQGLEFVIYTLTPWLRRWESALGKALLPPEQRGEYFIEFLVDGLLRGDFKTRMEGYASALNNGWLNPNEVREMENRNPIEGGDQYLRPLNLAPLGDPPEEV